MSIAIESSKSVSAETLLSDIVLLDNNELQNEIRHLATLTAAAMCRLLLLVSELDRREAWGDWGVRSCAHWLSWQCGFSLGTSREHVRVARALPGLHLVIAMFASGEISYAKVRAITRVAKPENEELLAQYAKHCTAGQLEAIVHHFRKHNELANYNEANKSRQVQWRTEGGGAHTLTIRMTSEERAIIERSHGEFMSNVSAETSEDKQQQVEAFVLMAQAALASTSVRPKDTHLVHLNVSAEALSEDQDGECNVDGHDIPPETARRLSCDAPVVVSLIDGDGVVLKMGRKTRLFTGASRAAVLKRDRGTCIFPGCDETKWVDVHHIQHWSKGGLTDPENGAVLCWFHHRLVHEGGYSLDHTFTFYTPKGNPVMQSPVIRPIDRLTMTEFEVRPNGCVSKGNGERFDMSQAVGDLVDFSQVS